MRVRILGPVGVWVDGVEVAIPSGKPRAVLAMLALAAGRPVSAEQLFTGLWGEDPPLRAARTLQVHVSTLRSRLKGTEAAVVLEAGGYRLDVDAEAIDVGCFERLAERGFAALAEARPDVASRCLHSALEEWSGEPLSNVLEAAFAGHEADRLALRRLAVTQGRVEADLALGLGVTLVDELRSVAEANPYDERACGQLMVALYRAGQAIAALATYRAFRATVGELGLEVGPELVEVERRVLVHDDRLLAQPVETAARRCNLPQEVSRFIGRESECETLAESIGRSRLTTVTGAGGAGKTRLALAVAGSLLDRFTDGVWLVELAPLSTSDTMAAAVAQAVGARPDDGVDGVAKFIGARSLLVVLDNCEHLIDASSTLAHTLLRRCPNLTILATSREQLAIDGEQVYRLPSLGLVDVESSDVESSDVDAIRRCDAVRLFADRAALQRPGFVIHDDNAATAARICSRLDGMPLAIELAAARLRTLSINDLARRLDERFRLLTGSGRHVLARQQTLRALIDWSYDLLSDREQRILGRLSVFVGGFCVEAAEAICADDPDLDALELVTALVDKSLVEISDEDTGRFRLLETIRQYALERMAERSQHDAESVQLAHARHYLGIAEAAAPALEQGPGQLEWLERLSADHDNLRAAANTFVAAPNGVDEGLRLVNSLHEYWDIRAQCQEGATTITALLGHPAAVEHSAPYVLALCHAVDMLERFGALGRASEMVDQAERLAKLVGSADLEVMAALRSSTLAARDGRFEQALDLLRPFLEVDLAAYQTIRLNMMWAYICLFINELASARVALDVAASVARTSGNQRRLASILSNLSCVDVAAGDLESATRHLQEAKTCAARIGDRTTLLYINANLGLVAIQAGDTPQAWIRYREALLGNLSGGDLNAIHCCLLGLALCSSARGDLSDAVVLHGVVDAEYRESETILDPIEAELMFEDQARLRQALGETEFARALERGRTTSLAEAIEFARNLGDGSAKTTLTA